MPSDPLAARRLLGSAVRRVRPLQRLVAERDELRRELDDARAGLRRAERKRKSLQRVVREKDGELGRWHEGQRPEASRQDLDYLFIVTYGRSGSTLLQGILSSTPGVLIRGENAGALYHLYQFHQACLREREARAATLAPSHPQFGIEGYPADVALADIRALVLNTLLRPEPDSRVVGFKEIRWYQHDVEGYVDFVRAVFPAAKFVFNSRDLPEVARSGWWAEKPDALTQLQAMDDRLRALADALAPDAFWVHFNDYVADPTQLRGLFDWLGAEYDEQRVRQALAVHHSY